VTFYRSIPKGSEQGAIAAAAEAIGALAGHSGKGGGAGDAAGAHERNEEAQLALGRPAVAAHFGSSSLAHRPAWNTNELL